MATSNPSPAVRMTGDAIANHLAEIASYFVPGVKLSLLARNPDFPDGSRDMLISNDSVDGMIAALEHLRTPAYTTEHRG